MSDEEFGFSDEAANHEPDEFAWMDKEDFSVLLDTAYSIMDKQDVPTRAEAIKKAKEILLVFETVVACSSRIGYKKYGVEEFRRLVMRELTDGKKPCVHGHISPITDCGACELERHTKKLPKQCDHTRIDYSAPCPECSRQENTFRHTMAEAFIRNKEGELQAIIAVLLEKLGGRVDLNVYDLQRITDLGEGGGTQFVVEPSTTDWGLTMRVVKPIGGTGGNPSERSAEPAWYGGDWAEEPDDLPF